MSTTIQQSNVSILHRFNESVFENRDLDSISEFMTDDVVQYLGRTEYHGIDETRDYFERMIEAFDDVHIDFAELVAEDEWVIGRYVASGTNTGPLSINDEMTVDATDESATWEGFVSARFDDGRMTEVHMVADMVSLFEQLGIEDRLLHATA